MKTIIKQVKSLFKDFNWGIQKHIIWYCYNTDSNPSEKDFIKNSIINLNLILDKLIVLHQHQRIVAKEYLTKFIYEQNENDLKECERIMFHTINESKRFDSVFDIFYYVQKILENEITNKSTTKKRSKGA